MKQKHLKAVRLIVSLFFLIALASIFVDFREMIPTTWVHRIHGLQFIPSVINFVSLLSVSAAGFIIVLLLTLLFGRVYCSTLCPLGILQDVFSFLSRKLSIKKRYKYTRPLNLLRYGFLILSVVSLAVWQPAYPLPSRSLQQFWPDIFRPGTACCDQPQQSCWRIICENELVFSL